MGSLSLFFGLLMTASSLSPAPPANVTPDMAVAPSAMAMPASARMPIEAGYAPARPTASAMTAREREFVAFVNMEREERGLNRLTADPMLVKVARAHSREMGDMEYFSHTSPTKGLKSPLDRYLAMASRPSWALVGENLFYCSIVDVERGHKALMNSEGHRANILEDRYERIGVGEYITEDGRYYVTQMFLARKD
ncbi:MAG: hypothetical protein KBC96_10615 [Armatimonadetes bacterium]|nr:hypothetical protein [Armatimonadota bacterium]